MCLWVAAYFCQSACVYRSLWECWHVYRPYNSCQQCHCTSGRPTSNTVPSRLLSIHIMFKGTLALPCIITNTSNIGTPFFRRDEDPLGPGSHLLLSHVDVLYPLCCLCLPPPTLCYMPFTHTIAETLYVLRQIKRSYLRVSNKGGDSR